MEKTSKNKANASNEEDKETLSTNERKRTHANRKFRRDLSPEAYKKEK